MVAADQPQRVTPERESVLERRVVRVIQQAFVATGLVLVFLVAGAAPLLMYPRPGLILLAAASACVVSHPWLLRGRRARRWRATLRLRWIELSALPWVLAAAVAFALFNVLMPQLAVRYISTPPPPSPPYPYAGEPLGFALVPLHLLVFAPLAEELIFRGYLQSSLARTLGWRPALLVTAGLFGLFHGSLAWAPFAAFAGLVFGGAVLATRSLLAAVLMHATANAATAAVVGREWPDWVGRLVDGPGIWLLAPVFAVTTVALLAKARRSRATPMRPAARMALGRGKTERQPA